MSVVTVPEGTGRGNDSHHTTGPDTAGTAAALPQQQTETESAVPPCPHSGEEHASTQGTSLLCTDVCIYIQVPLLDHD